MEDPTCWRMELETPLLVDWFYLSHSGSDYVLLFQSFFLFLPPSPYQSDLPYLSFTKNSAGQKVAAIYSASQSGKAVFLWNH